MEHLLTYARIAMFLFAFSYFVKKVTGTTVFPLAMALSADANTPTKQGFIYYRPLAAGVKIYAGALVGTGFERQRESRLSGHRT